MSLEIVRSFKLLPQYTMIVDLSINSQDKSSILVEQWLGSSIFRNSNQ